MKKILLLSFLAFGVLAFGISSAQAQFVTGDRVQTTAFLNVRSAPSTASGTLLGTQSVGALGNIVSGPVSGSGYTWWNVNYDIVPDGWSVGDYLTKVSTSTGSNCGDVNKDGQPNVFDLNLIIDVAFRRVTSTYATDVNGSGATDVFDVNEEIDYLFSGGPEPTGCSSVTNQPPANLSISGPGSSTSTGNYWSFRAVDPEGFMLTYSVNWGDGNSSNSPIASGYTWGPLFHQYSSNGTYTIVFTATDQGGLSSSLTKLVTINVTGPNQPPVINSFTGPSSVVAGTNNTWQAQATDPNGNPITYVFNWGDSGYPVSSTVSGASGATVSVSNKVYWTPGTYTQTLQAWDTPYSGWVQQTRNLIVVASSSPTSTSPIPKTIYPTPSTSPKTLTPIAASALDVVQAQLDAIKNQLQYLLMQMR